MTLLNNTDLAQLQIIAEFERLPTKQSNNTVNSVVSRREAL